MSEKFNRWQTEEANCLVVNTSQTEQISDCYHHYLTQWKAATHPGTLQITHWQIESTEVRLYLSDPLMVTPVESHSLSGFEKLAAIRQALDLLHRLKISLDLHPDQVWFHRAGYAHWLPASPDYISQLSHSSEIKNNHLAILLKNWFNYSPETMDNFSWEWRMFWQAYEKVVFDLNWADYIDSVFFKAWPYATANRLAMKEGYLSPEAMALLSQFGQTLGLEKQTRMTMDVLAQRVLQKRPEPTLQLFLDTLSNSK